MQQKPITEIVRRRQPANQTLDQALIALRDHYLSLDRKAMDKFVNVAVKMFANYENKWSGSVNRTNSTWIEDDVSDVDELLTVPLLTANVDQAMTAYTKLRPSYIAKAVQPTNYLHQQLAKMCQEVASAEYRKMFRNIDFQREFQYMALATLSYRQILMGYRRDSPIVHVKETSTEEMPFLKMKCAACGHEEAMQMPEGEEGMMHEQMEGSSVEQQESVAEGPEPPETGERYPEPSDEPVQKPNMAGQMTCPHCLGEQISAQREMRPVQVERQRAVRLPRPIVSIPNPITIQPDFETINFENSRFIIRRRKIPKKTAEFIYQLDLSGENRQGVTETQLLETKQREPMRDVSTGQYAFDIGQYVQSQAESVEETELWLDPSEYGFLVADGQLLVEMFPVGLYVKMVGDQVVEARDCNKSIEWIRLVHGVRPSSTTGVGMVHLADLNDVINNCLSLEYSVLRVHGFPFRVLRGKYLKGLPQALQTLIATNIPDDFPLQQLVHTEAGGNASGMLGVLSGRVEGYMQYVGGTMSPLGSGAADIRDLMGTATGATALQTMMSDRQGLAIQMRVDADIATYWSILRLLQADERNREFFADEYDQGIIDAFFKEDLESIFTFEPVKGSDEPQIDSVNTFKVQSFAQLTANLTGLRQFDKQTFYDIIAQIGETLNIPVEVGVGRKERNLAKNRIVRIKQLYKQSVEEQPEFADLDPTQQGMLMFQAVTGKEKMLIAGIVQSQMSQMPINNPDQAAIMAQTQASALEAYLYDFEALIESYSDWLQSDEGQGAPIPVQVAVGLLYSYAQQMKDQREQMELSKQMQMQGLMGLAQMQQAAAAEEEAATEKKDKKESGSSQRKSGPKQKEEKAPKSDGTFGPGRPKQVAVEGEYTD